MRTCTARTKDGPARRRCRMATGSQQTCLLQSEDPFTGTVPYGAPQASVLPYILQVFRHASARHRGVVVSVPRNRPRAAERNFTTSSSFSKGLINPHTGPIISHAMTTKQRKPLCLKHAYLQTCYFVRCCVRNEGP